ncbi:MAG: DUF493 family protein [Betaproteobacteria bacterium]|nr:DUF493 family protein [Betaproteobacteria bacterium]
MPDADKLLQFPCDFPIKIMGRNVPRFSQDICDLICQHAPDFNPATLEIRASSKANYIGLGKCRPRSLFNLDRDTRGLCDAFLLQARSLRAVAHRGLFALDHGLGVKR